MHNLLRVVEDSIKQGYFVDNNVVNNIVHIVIPDCGLI